MIKATLIVAGLAFGAGCKKHSFEEPPTAPNGSAATTNSAPATPVGTAATTGPASSGVATAAPLPMTPEDLVKRFHECWGFWGSGKWNDFRSCYATNALAEAPGNQMPVVSGNDAIVEMAKVTRAAFPDQAADPRLLLVNGKTVAGITLLTGKNTGGIKVPHAEMAVTNNKIGLYLGQVLTFDNTGRVAHEEDFLDMATLQGQLKPIKDHPVRSVIEKLPAPEQDVIAKDDTKEKENLATFQQATDHLNKHDADGFGALIADSVTWSERPLPKDMNKKELMAGLRQMWNGFSDLTFKIRDSWAAGDYVAAVESFEGTNDSDLPMMHVKRTGKKVSLPFFAVYKLSGGKIEASWIFFQGMGLASQLGISPPAPGAKSDKKSSTDASKTLNPKK